MTLADKMIERGQKLYDLKHDDGFALFMARIDERIEVLSAERERWDETEKTPAASLTRITHKLRELIDLKEWLDDEIARCGRYKSMREAEVA